MRPQHPTAVRALQHGQDSRVFENQTVPQILEEVFKEALEPFSREVRLNLSRTYPVREYCTQYKESDWDFVQRLMVDEGITFYLDEGGKEADRETVVLVDSNDSFPEIETMGSEECEEPLLPLAPTPEQGWFELEVIWDDTGQPVSGLSLKIEPRDGGPSSERTCTTDSSGSVRLQTDSASCNVRSGLRNSSVDQCAVFASSGELSGAAPSHGAETPRPCPKAIVRAENRKVRSGETLESIADELGLTTQDLAFFNFGTKDQAEVNDHLKMVVGCTRKGPDGKSYVFDNSDSPGEILVPLAWSLKALASERKHTVRIKPIPQPAVTVNLLIALDIDPKDPVHVNDRFVLQGPSDFRCEKSVSDDCIPENDRLQLLFEGLRNKGSYTLEVHSGDGMPSYRIFENKTYEALRKAGA